MIQFVFIQLDWKTRCRCCQHMIVCLRLMVAQSCLKCEGETRRRQGLILGDSRFNEKYRVYTNLGSSVKKIRKDNFKEMSATPKFEKFPCDSNRRIELSLKYLKD